MRNFKRRIGVALLAVATGVVMSQAVAAPANAGWLYPQYYWSAFSTSAHVWGEAYTHDFGCGLKDCAETENLYFQAGRLSGQSVDQSRVRAVARFGGTGLNVSVSYPWGVSVGFTDGGSSCNHGYWSAPGNWVDVDLGSGVICEADTWGWVSNASVAATGAIRDGSSWSVRTGSDCESMGGGGC